MKDIRHHAKYLAQLLWSEVPELDSLDIDRLSEGLAVVGYAMGMIAARAKDLNRLNTAPVLLQGLRIGLSVEERGALFWRYESEDGELLTNEDLDGKEVKNGFGSL